MSRKYSTMWFVGFDSSDSNAVKYGMMIKTLDFSRSLSIKALYSSKIREIVVSTSRDFPLSVNSLRISTLKKVGCLFGLINPNYFYFSFKGYCTTALYISLVNRFTEFFKSNLR